MKLNRTGSIWNRNERNKINDNWDKLEGNVNNFQGEITDKVFAEIKDSAKLNWGTPVNSSSELPSNSKEGDTRFTRDTGKVYRFDGKNWVEIQQIDAGPVNEVDSRLSSQVSEIDDELFYTKRGNRKTIKPSFVFIDDDGKIEVKTVLKGIMEGYNVPFTSAIITGRVGNSGYLTDSDIVNLYNDGVDIVSHTKTHPNLRTLTDEELDVELGESKTYLENLGIPIKHLMYPYGNTNDKVIRKTKEYYESACGTSAGINTSPIMTYHLRRLAVGSYSPIGDSLDDYKPYIDEVISKNGMCVFMTHIEETPKENISLIRQIIDYVRSKGYDFETYSEAYEKHKNALEQGLYTTSNQEHYNVVGADGTTLNSMTGVYTSRYDEFNSSSIPSEFRSRTKTITLIRDNNRSGFPLNRGGVLTTDRLSTDDVFTQQIYEPRGSGKEYVRYWSNGEWTEFIDKTGIEIIPSNNINFNSLLSKFPTSSVSICYINDANATGFPNNEGGIIKTYNITSDGIGAYQEFIPRRRSVKYVRFWQDLNNRWSAFRTDGAMQYTAEITGIDKPITEYFPFAVTISVVKNVNAQGFPNNRGGILKTYRLDTDGDFCYQEFKPYTSNNLYIRTWLPSSNSWNEFTLIGGIAG